MRTAEQRDQSRPLTAFAAPPRCVQASDMIDKKFNLEFFPDGDLTFYKMPNISIKDTNIAQRLEELEQFIKRQIKKRDTEKIAKIMGID